MASLEATILPYLFMVLAAFIFLNLLMNICLYSFARMKNVRMLCWYWATLLLTYAFQGFFQTGELSIVLSYSSNVIPAVIMAMILFDTMGRVAPLNLYFSSWLVALLLTPFLHWLDLGFTAVAMPLSMAMGLVPLSTAYQLLWKQKAQTSGLQKFMGVLLLVAFTHFINFAIFRMGNGNQLWGWALGMGLYQLFSVLMFALVMEDNSRKETERLQELVDLRTQDLSAALKVKQTLFRMVLHDIASPIQGQLWIVGMLEKKPDTDKQPQLIQKLSEMTDIIKRVVEQVRSLEAVSSGKLEITPTPVNFEQCYKDIRTVFDQQLTEKNIELEVINELSEDTIFLADQTIFTTSVLGNLISNAIKFSPDNSTLTLRAYELDDKVIIEVKDRGVGMSEELAYTIFDPTKRNSRLGTNGEKGTGFGMAQVKSYVEFFGGKIDIKSWPMDAYPDNHGTKITVTMDKNLSHVQ